MKTSMPGLSRRAVLGALCGSALLPRFACAEIVVADPPPLLSEDYATARKGFRTRLTKIGPSPDAPEPLDAPPGAERIAYHSDGLELTAWISPAQRGRLQPGLLYLHGGNVLGAGHWDLTLLYRQAGYTVLMPALRGENGQDGSFSGFYDENADVLAAANHLSGLPGVDPDRIFLAGHSIGGTQVLLASMSSAMFRGATSFSGGSDAWRFFAHFPEMICFDTTNQHEFEMRSAVSFAGSFKCPVRLFHGSKETRLVPTTQLTVQRARNAGLDVETAVIEGDHFSALREESERSLAFFSRL